MNDDPLIAALRSDEQPVRHAAVVLRKLTPVQRSALARAQRDSRDADRRRRVVMTDGEDGVRAVNYRTVKALAGHGLVVVEDFQWSSNGHLYRAYLTAAGLAARDLICQEDAA